MVLASFINKLLRETKQNKYFKMLGVWEDGAMQEKINICRYPFTHASTHTCMNMLTYIS